jgi:hypothetical protein
MAKMTTVRPKSSLVFTGTGLDARTLQTIINSATLNRTQASKTTQPLHQNTEFKK